MSRTARETRDSQATGPARPFGLAAPARRARILASWALCLGCVVSFPGRSVQAQATPASPSAQSAAASNELEAREAFARGRAAYDAGEFDGAAQAFEKAYAMSGRSGLLYNLYLAYRDANRQEQAAEALRNYLQKDAQAPNRAQLEAKLKALDESIAARRRADEEEARARSEPRPAAEPVLPAPVTVPVLEPAPDGRRWWLGPVVVMGAGGVLAVASAIPGAMALGKQGELDDACRSGVCDDSLRSVDDKRKTLAVTSDVMLFGGIAVASAGAVWLLVKRASLADAPSVSGGCTPRGCAASWTSHF